MKGGYFMVDILKSFMPDRTEGSIETKFNNLDSEFGDTSVIPLWIADMDFAPAKEIKKALSDYIDKGQFGYFFPVWPEYHETLNKWSKEQFNYETKSEWYRYCPGICTGLAFTFQALTQPNDKVLILNPVYNPFRTVIQDAGRELVMQDLQGDEISGYTIDFDAMEKSFKEDNITAFLLCSPHNPVGRVWTEEELSKIVALCRDYDVLLLSDEAHRDLVWQDHVHYPTASVANGYSKIVTYGAPSKPFGLAGFNHSYMIIEDDTLRAEYDAYLKTIHLGEGTAGGYISTQAAYEHGNEWLVAVRKVIWQNYEILKTTLETALPEIKIADLQGTYLSWLDLGAYIPAKDLRKVVQDDARLGVNYGSMYWPTKEADTHIRINLATTSENIEKAADNLIIAIKAYTK